MLKKVLFTVVIMGTSMRTHTQQWKNWANNQQCTATIITPKNMPELVSIIKKANTEQATVHAVGSSHSWSDIVCVDGYLINTDKLNKLISVNIEKNQVTVQAGIKLKDLNAQLAKLGLCLSNQAAITKQSLAGAISTATHGSGKTGTLASFVTKVQLLTADGSLKTFSKTENKDLFGAIRTSMGTLGIMTELTVQCEPLFKVARETKTIDWQAALKTYQDLLNDNDFMEFHWNVSDDSVDIKIHNRVTPETNSKKNNNKNVGDSYKMLSGTLLVKYVEEEIAIPLDKFVEAAQAARELVRKNYKKSSQFHGILFRFVSAEKHNFLSPASGRDVVYFSITTPFRSGYEQFYKEYYDLMLKFSGRPHWGKINYLTKNDVQKLYGKKYEKFVAVRKKLDPQGMFSNHFTRNIFGW